MLSLIPYCCAQLPYGDQFLGRAENGQKPEIAMHCIVAVQRSPGLPTRMVSTRK